jgi:1-acyl-sn-glycerol-3-phosphate acyltransferase
MAWCMMHPSPSWQIQIEHTELLNKTTPTIYVCNHESFLDIPLIYQLPTRMKWVVKHSMTYIPIMGWMVRLTGQLTINRSKKSALKKLNNLVQPLKSGIPVMLFPEGTRSLDGSLQPFKNGAFLLAMEHGFPIQPLVIEGAFEVLRSGSSLFQPKAHFLLRVLPSVDPKEFASMSELKQKVQRNISDALTELESAQQN